MSVETNIANTKKAYAAFNVGDLPGVLENMDPDIEWVVAGNSTVSGTYRGTQDVIAFWMKLLDQNVVTMPMAFLGDGDQVVVLTRTSFGEETSEAADILEFRDGRCVRFRSLGDAARFERVFGLREE
ncbi:nuclear transport factor 2 family protein [Marmoricola sp. RAF53]|uniref:nuclear transport factor 2 family protein n=1 Tax=Marmoricola sp. RAF53 TaxID=3233059 RepID=UPI003F9BD3CF